MQGQLQLKVFDAAPQVTALLLHFHKLDSHEDIAALLLERLFPGLQGLFIKLHINECAICGPFGPLQIEVQCREYRPEGGARAEACRQATEAQMRLRFPLIHLLFATF